MSGSPSSAPTGVPAPRPEDPAATAAADRRVLVLAVVIMLLLVSVGVVSGALFNRSACATIDPDPVAAGAAGGAGDVDEVLEVTFAETDEVTRRAMAGALGTLAERLGPLTGIAEVTGASDLGVTERGVAALGPVTSLLSPRGSEVLARADVGDGRVVGDGGTLYSVAAVNELTGQVDAVVPLDPDLRAGTCVNTSLINSPLAFALDAGGGELLLLRIDEDGGEPELELRDAETGRVWGAPLDIGIAQPGLQGERLTARLGPGSVVTGLRTGPGDDAPVLTGVERGSGEIGWDVSRDDLGSLLDEEFAQAVTVWAVGQDRAIVTLSPDRDPDDPDGPAGPAALDPTRLLALDVGSGERIWDLPLETDVQVRHVLLDGDATWVTTTDGDQVGFDRLDGDGEVAEGTGTSGDDGRTAVLDDGRVVTASAGTVGVVDEDGLFGLGSDLTAREVVAHGGYVTLLLEAAEGGTIAATFEP